MKPLCQSAGLDTQGSSAAWLGHIEHSWLPAFPCHRPAKLAAGTQLKWACSKPGTCLSMDTAWELGAFARTKRHPRLSLGQYLAHSLTTLSDGASSTGVVTGESVHTLS